LPVYAKDIATVNGKPVTDKDLSLALSNMNDGQRDAVLKDLNSRSQVLQNVIDRMVVSQEAEKLKMDQDPEFKSLLEQVRQQLLMMRLLEKQVGPQVSQSAAKKYYETHKDQFNTDLAHVQHILLKDEATAKKVLALAKDKKNDFQELAVKYSIDPSAKNNRGDLGFIGRDTMVPEFNEVVFSVNEGEPTGPVQTTYGYHVVKVIERKIGKPLGFDEVELRAINALRQQLGRNYIDGLRSNAKIKIDQQALDQKN
jgi:peptidyl-prolyl cis-trans isomerase C